MSESLPLPKVLVVNDDASTLLALSSVLTDPVEGPKYEVFLVQSGQEALREVLKHDFAVILLDVSMPGMDGFETADAIHSHPRSSLVPIIFITAFHGDELNRLKGYQRGAADYLFAPIMPQVVQAKVAVFVELNLKTLELERKTEALQAINGDLRFQRIMDLERANIALQAEVNERRLAEQRATELASRDSLTGLLNRQVLLHKLNCAITASSQNNQSLALITITLNRFRDINLFYGHHAGDELLKHLASHLTQGRQESDVVARLGSDEFVIVVQGVDDRNYAEKTAENIRKHFSKPEMDVGGKLIKASIFVGVSRYPENGITPETLINNAYATVPQPTPEPVVVSAVS